MSNGGRSPVDLDSTVQGRLYDASQLEPARDEKMGEVGYCRRDGTMPLLEA